MIGIHLGSCETRMASLVQDSLMVLRNSQGDEATPTVAAQTSQGILLGQQAVRAARAYGIPLRGFVAHPDDTRVLGTVTGEALTVAFLERLRCRAAEMLRSNETDAVFTVPGFLSYAGRQQIRACAERAGWKRCYMLNHSVAEGLGYLLSNPQENVLVVRFGARGAETVWMEHTDGVFEVLHTWGREGCGGNAWTARILDWIDTVLEESYQISAAWVVESRQEMERLAEEAREMLSSSPYAEIPLTIRMPGAALRQLVLRLMRDTFERLIAQDLESVFRDIVKAVRETERVAHAPLKHVVLSGGAGQTPLVGRMVRDILMPYTRGSRSLTALGAAGLAGIKDGRVRDRLLLDALPFGFCVGPSEERAETLLAPDTAIPVRQRIRVQWNAQDGFVPFTVFEEREGKKQVLWEKAVRLPGVGDGPVSLEVQGETDFWGILDVSVFLPGQSEPLEVTEKSAVPAHAQEKEQSPCTDARPSLRTAENPGNTETEPENAKPETSAPRDAEGEKRVLIAMLDVMDNLERALLVQTEDSPLKTGVAMTLRQMQDCYRRFGVEEINPLGEMFDPHIANAVMMGEKEEGEAGHVCQVILKGYRQGESILRYAQVKVVPF